MAVLTGDERAGAAAPFPVSPRPVPSRRSRWQPAAEASAESSFTECYNAAFHGLTTQLYGYTGDLSLAQDLVQEAFCRAFTRWSTIVEYDDPVAWIRRVAFNLAHNRWRRAKTAMRYLMGQREEHVAGPDPDRVHAVTALAKLPAPHRRAIVLHHLADMSVADIAAQEGVPAGTVKSWLHRGRSALAALLDDGIDGVGTVTGSGRHG